MLPANLPDHDATNTRAVLVEEIDIWRRINGKSPADANITDMLARHVPSEADTPRTLEWDPRDRPEFTPVRYAFPRPDQGDRPGIHRVQDANRAMAPNAATLKQIADLMAIISGRVIGAERALVAARAHLAAVRAAARAIPAADAIAAAAAARAIQDAMRMLEATAREYDDAVEYEEYVRAQISKWGHTEPAPLIVESTKKGESATPKPMTPEERAELKNAQIAAQKVRDKAAREQGGVKNYQEDPEREPDEDDDNDDSEGVEISTPDPSKPWQKRTRYLTDKAAGKAAKKLGYHRVKNPDLDTQGRAVFWNPKTKDFISRDTTSHRGTWKRFDKYDTHRTGTWNADLSTKVGP